MEIAPLNNSNQNWKNNGRYWKNLKKPFKKNRMQKKIISDDYGIKVVINLEKFFDEDDIGDLDIISGTIKLMDFTKDHFHHTEDAIIGEFEAYYLTEGFDNFLIQLDNHSINSSQYGEELNQQVYEDLLEFDNNLIILSTVEINEEYRGNGIIKKVVETLQHYFKCPIMVKPFPLQYCKTVETTKEIGNKQYKLDLKKVKNAYEKCEFKTIKKRSEYMMNMGEY
jgi:hypothetical protein